MEKLEWELLFSSFFAFSWCIRLLLTWKKNLTAKNTTQDKMTSFARAKECFRASAFGDYFIGRKNLRRRNLLTIKIYTAPESNILYAFLLYLLLPKCRLHSVIVAPISFIQSSLLVVCWSRNNLHPLEFTGSWPVSE